MRVLVTGASGFIGGAVGAALFAQGHSVRAALRSVNSIPPGERLDMVAVGDLGPQTDWSAALAGVDCVVHCAAQTHVMHQTDVNAKEEYREVNVAGTRRLAEQAAALNVRRLVFLSSIKVNGEQTALDAPFLFSDTPAPEDSYGASKLEAEHALWAVSDKTGLELSVIRPPLVYGPGVKGNLLRLLRWVASGVPLPLGAVHNQRSLVSLSNLVDLLLHCTEHPAAAGQTFLVSDGQDLSTAQLIRLMAEGMSKPPRLLPVPVTLLRAGASLLGKGDELDRLTGSLLVNIEHTRETLTWTPPFSVEQGVREMARWWAGRQDS